MVLAVDLWRSTIPPCQCVSTGKIMERVPHCSSKLIKIRSEFAPLIINQFLAGPKRAYPSFYKQCCHLLPTPFGHMSQKVIWGGIVDHGEDNMGLVLTILQPNPWWILRSPSPVTGIALDSLGSFDNLWLCPSQSEDSSQGAVGWVSKLIYTVQLVNRWIRLPRLRFNVWLFMFMIMTIIIMLLFFDKHFIR